MDKQRITITGTGKTLTKYLQISTTNGRNAHNDELPLSGRREFYLVVFSRALETMTGYIRCLSTWPANGGHQQTASTHHHDKEYYQQPAWVTGTAGLKSHSGSLLEPVRLIRITCYDYRMVFPPQHPDSGPVWSS